MFKKICMFVAVLFVAAGCARVQVVAPEKPIKVDIAMRLDVYQHVEKEIDAIEELVSGGKSGNMLTSMIEGFAGTAYAEEALSADVEDAAMRRKARYEELRSAEASGRMGENRSGLLEIRGTGPDNGSLANLVSDENEDRMIIYRSLAARNGAALSDVQDLYAKKIQAGAPKGTPIQSKSGGWTVK